MKITTITWGDPPPAMCKPGGIFTSTILRALQANPGRWALIKAGHPTASAATGYARRHADYEVTTRFVNGAFDIYARFVGESGLDEFTRSAS
jgi:hypothetical protein